MTTFTDPRLAELDGFRVEIDAARERADVVLDRPPFNIISMPQRDQLRLVFETLDEDARVRVIVVRAIGEHFSSGGNIKGFMEATPETVSKLAWNIAAPARCSKPVIVANRGFAFGVGFELSLACDFRIVSETCFYALPEQRLGQIPGSGGSAAEDRRHHLTKDIVMRSDASRQTGVGLGHRDRMRQRWKPRPTDVLSTLRAFCPGAAHCQKLLNDTRTPRFRSQSSSKAIATADCASPTTSARASRRSTPSAPPNSREAERRGGVGARETVGRATTDRKRQDDLGPVRAEVLADGCAEPGGEGGYDFAALPAVIAASLRSIVGDGALHTVALVGDLDAYRPATATEGVLGRVGDQLGDDEPGIPALQFAQHDLIGSEDEVDAAVMQPRLPDRAADSVQVVGEIDASGGARHCRAGAHRVVVQTFRAAIAALLRAAGSCRGRKAPLSRHCIRWNPVGHFPQQQGLGLRACDV